VDRKLKMRRYTKKDFDRQFPDDATCLAWLKSYFYPDSIFCKKCDRVTSHHRITSRPSYCCAYCGHHVHPTAGTIFHRSPTRLTTWFYTVCLMASTRCGISAKQIERETGVTYKTAWRMVKRIRSMLGGGRPKKQTSQDDQPFTSDDFVTALKKASRKISPETNNPRKTPKGKP
jgi:hypothetical protein